MRVSVDDLEAAIEWLTDGYEGDDEVKKSLERVANFLHHEVSKREVNKGARKLAKETGLKESKARQLIIERMNK